MTRSLAAFMAVVLSACVFDGAAAQQPDRPTAPYLAPDHWAYTALKKARAGGLIGTSVDPGAWSVDAVEAIALLRSAADRAQVERPELAAPMAAYAARLEEELPHAAELAGEAGDAPGAGDARGAGAGVARSETGVDRRLAAGHVSHSGRMLVALGQPDFPEEDPIPLPEEAHLFGGVDATLYLGGWGAVHVDEAVRFDGELLEGGESYLLAGNGPVAGWLGRRRLRLGAGDGPIVLSGSSAVLGGGIETDGLMLPGIGRHLGVLRARVALGQVGENQPFADPWLWVVRASVQPHERFTLGLNRSAMVADVDQQGAEFLKHLAYVLIGKHGEGELNRADNQVASVELTWRPPLGALPLLTYLEWGLEDSAGSWRDVPGIVAGAYLSAVPGVPPVGLGAELASFATSCCGNPWWYRHRGFLAGWAQERRPLGHPLGGDGRQWTVMADVAVAELPVQAEARVYRRERRSENLFAPLRAGWSTGGAAEVSTLMGEFLGTLGAEYERGSSWDRAELVVQLSYIFR